MTTVTNSMFKAVIVGAIFLTLWAGFNFLFVGSQLGDTSHMSLDQILAASWGILTQPELLIINSVLIIVGLIVSLFTIRELLPV